MDSYCTIVDENYLPYAYSLYDSICSIHDGDFKFYVFISNCHSSANLTRPLKENINYIYIDEICDQGLGKRIYQNYYIQKINAFRWSMKPVLMNYIFDVFKVKKVFCLDCDVRFFNNTRFLFDLLDNSHVLLSPHFRSSDPVNNNANFILQYNAGIFNGGFIGGSYLGKKAINWWAEICSTICEFDPCKGQYFDQVHLNLLPVYFDNVHIIKHRGCNVANWNLKECKRFQDVNGKVLIDERFPVVFIHFTKSTMMGILRGEDRHLTDYFREYSVNVKKYNDSIDLMTFHSNLLKEEIAFQEKRRAEKNVRPGIFKRIYLKMKSIIN